MGATRCVKRRLSDIVYQQMLQVPAARPDITLDAARSERPGLPLLAQPRLGNVMARQSSTTPLRPPRHLQFETIAAV